jgi:hypothetical protein
MSPPSSGSKNKSSKKPAGRKHGSTCCLFHAGSSEVTRSSRGLFRLHLQCQKISKALLATCFTLVSCLACSSTLKLVKICSSEISLHFQRTRRRYTPEDISRQLPPQDPQMYTCLLIHNCHPIILASLHRQGHTLQCMDSSLM